MGKNVAVLRHKESDQGTLTGGSWLVGLPLANIRDTDIKKVARSTSVAVGHTQFRIDFGTVAVRYLQLFVLLNHNISAAGTVRFVLTNDAADVGARVLDSGALPPAPVAVAGDEPWGGFGLDGTSPSPYALTTTLMWEASEAKTARYLFVYVSDAANPAGYIDIGRFLAGPAWRPVTNVARFELQPVSRSTARRTHGGRRIAKKRSGYRRFIMAFEFLSKPEAIGFIGGWALAGIDEDVFVVFDSDEYSGGRERRAIYCALEDLPGLSEQIHDIFDVTVVVEELT